MLGTSAFLDETLALDLPKILTAGMLTFSGVKLYADGAFGCATVYLPDGYRDNPHNHGILYHDPAEFHELLYRAHAAGLPTGTHAQSPAAIELTIAAIETAQRRTPRPDIRHAIEHCSMPTDAQISRMARAGIIPKSQPQHHLYFGEGLFELVGDKLAHRYNPIGLYHRAGIPVALSSDAPVVPPRPLEAIQAAIEHRTSAGRRLGDSTLQVDTITALKGYTINGAFAMHRERELGSLESGKFADLVILDTDPTAIPIDQISTVEVEATWVAGKPSG
jgi:predicted amidohydrolase YtcJ